MIHNFIVQITDIEKDCSYYVTQTSLRNCRYDEFDKKLARMVFDTEEVITMGKFIGRPIYSQKLY